MCVSLLSLAGVVEEVDAVDEGAGGENGGDALAGHVFGLVHRQVIPLLEQLEKKSKSISQNENASYPISSLSLSPLKGSHLGFCRAARRPLGRRTILSTPLSSQRSPDLSVVSQSQPS